MSTAKLEKQLTETNLALLEAKKRQGQCEQSKSNIEDFQYYLQSLDEEIAERHAAVRKAESDLDDAQWALDDLEQKLAEQKQLVSDATNLLTGSQSVVQEAQQKVSRVKKEEDQFIEQIGAAKNQLGEMREKLANMKKASEAILEIKKYVSATAWKMGYFVDIAVREPVREIGLVEETNVWDYFSENVASEQCSADFKHQLTDFHQYCTGPAMAGFEKVKKYIDLTPICTLDEESKIASEEDKAVQARISLLTKDLEGVQSWLDPFKGTTMTTEKEQKKVELGEPEVLRHVMAVYGDINFYRGYLKHWKAHGKFHELLKQLTGQMKVLEEDIMQEDALLQQLKDALAVVSKAREEGKEELERVMASLETNVEETKNLLTDLEEVLKQAMRLYKEARAKLVSEHTAGKDGLFSLGQVHEGVLND